MEVRSVEKGVVLITPPLAGTANMEIDEVLLANADSDSPVILRIYQWSEPTLSLGHFQSIDDRNESPELASVAYVRRKTGGGAILHDHELTYSLIVPSRSASRKGHSDKLYRSVHLAIADGVNSLGWNAILSETCTCSAMSNQKHEPFLCFLRRSPVDLIVGEHKIVGSAQRRTKNGLLQHGSLLIRSSQVTPSLLGLLDIPNSNQSDSFEASSFESFHKTHNESDFWTRAFLSWLKLGVSRVMHCDWKESTVADFPAIEGLVVGENTQGLFYSRINRLHTCANRS